MAENMHFDELHRVIYKIVRKCGYTEEWWFEYDKKSTKYDKKDTKRCTKYIKEKKPF